MKFPTPDMRFPTPFFLTNKKFILSISILFFLLVCGKDNTQKQKEWELKKLNLGINFGFPSFIQIPAPMREFPKIFDIKLSFAIRNWYYWSNWRIIPCGWETIRQKVFVPVRVPRYESTPLVGRISEKTILYRDDRPIITDQTLLGTITKWQYNPSQQYAVAEVEFRADYEKLGQQY
jgi:hypothetical protein